MCETDGDGWECRSVNASLADGATGFSVGVVSVKKEVRKLCRARSSGRINRRVPTVRSRGN